LKGGHEDARLFYKIGACEMNDHLEIKQITGLKYRQQPLRGMVQIAGPDRLDFLQRLTSNDVKILKGEKVVLTVLTSPIGRILDVLYLFEDEEQVKSAVFSISLTGRTPDTYAYLKSRIFFMDKVEISDVSSEYVFYNLVGEDAAKVLQKFGFQDLPEEAGQWTEIPFNNNQLRLFRHDPHLGLGFQLIASHSMQVQVRNRLEELGVSEMTPEEYASIRVEAGIPAVDREISEEHTPLEINLENAISTSKGCYTGQEVIARQMNYDKVTRKLVGLYLESSATAGTQLRAGDKPAGKITSYVLSPRLGPIALAIVKRPYHQEGTQLTFQDNEAVRTVLVTHLPFLR
jgi:tRNA-modifying protein YgfZ